MTDSPDLTPAERRRAKVRASILEAAETVFADEGADGLSIRRIADAIDYSPAAIYKYFASKDDLLFELQEAFFAELMEKADVLEAHHGSFHERSRICLATYVHTALAKSHHYAAAFAGIIDTPRESDRDFFGNNKGRAFGILLNLVDEGQRLGCVRQDLHSTAAAKSLWASCHGLASLMVHMPEFQNSFPNDAAMSQEEFIAFHADQIMRGLETSSPVLTKTQLSSRKRNT
jgi:AcrR family transcriptional regulator